MLRSRHTLFFAAPLFIGVLSTTGCFKLQGNQTGCPMMEPLCEGGQVIEDEAMEGECPTRLCSCPDGTINPENGVCASETGMDCSDSTTVHACQTNADCACGTNTETGQCDFGNSGCIDTDRQCPDFCHGIGGSQVIACVEGVCTPQECPMLEPQRCEGGKIIYTLNSMGCRIPECQCPDGTNYPPDGVCNNENTCHTSADCDGSGGFCLAPGQFSGCGICRDAGEMDEATCETDQECVERGTGTICEVAGPEACFCSSTKVCLSGCTTNAECGEAQVCSTDHRCVPQGCGDTLVNGGCPNNFNMYA